MAIFQGTVLSKSMWMMTSITVSMPEERKPDTDVPVILLPHGLTGNNLDWLRGEPMSIITPSNMALRL